MPADKRILPPRLHLREERAVPAVFNNREGTLELIGPLGPFDASRTQLTLDDVNRNEQPELIFTAANALEVWGSKNGRLVFLLHSDSTDPYELRDVGGDGGCLLTFWRRPPGAAHAEGLRWVAHTRRMMPRVRERCDSILKRP